jgi:DNA replication licensing factor MCM7
MHYVGLLCEAADDLMPQPTSTPVHDIYDQLTMSRADQEQRAAAGAGRRSDTAAAARAGAGNDANDANANNNNNNAIVDTAAAAGDATAAARAAAAGGLPAALTRRYDCYVHAEKAHAVTRMRRVCARDVGRLVRVRGVVTHVTDVKPLASVITYTDEESGTEVYQEVVGRTFMPLDAQGGAQGAARAASGAAAAARAALAGGPGAGPTARAAAAARAATGAKQMQTRGSRFVKFQEVRLQECADEVPEGATPRTLALHLRGEVTRRLRAGDDVVVTGVFLPEPFTGWKALRAGLLTSTHVEVMACEHGKASYADYSVTQEHVAAIEQLGREGGVFDRLAASIAPEIFGHRDVKKVLLLQMVGGVPRSFPDGMRLRGDIHVCLMGDPGVAKSQLLKHVARVAPRAVYTTGKGSSGVGLTAAVMRNQVTKELVLEGGALVLADKGVCCIDEFDKMDEADRTNIHEAMEQQTISIAKAGITTTLNTRTTLLAAANPAFGRWNPHRTPAENINMPPALLSRFDVMWLLLDRAEPEMDARLARHILNVHQGVVDAPEGLAGGGGNGAGNNANTSNNGGLVPPDVLRAYIALARRQEPYVAPELADYVCAHYVSLRQKEADALEGSSYVTPRTLMSLLRLSQAVAKLRFDSAVSRSDVDAALALMRASQASIEPELARRQREDPVSRCYRRLRDFAVANRRAELSWADVRGATALERLSDEVLEQCVREYEAIAVWSVVRDAGTGTIAAVVFPEEDVLGAAA